MISYWGIEHGEVTKSYVPGKGWIPATKLTPKQRAKVPGGHEEAKGVSYKDLTWRANHNQHKQNIAANQHMVGIKQSAWGPSRAGTYRVGGKKTGRSTVMGSANNGKDLKYLLRHEDQHAKVQRSSYRLHRQIAGSPKKTMREEARADQFSGAAPWRKAQSNDSIYASAARYQRDAKKKPNAPAKGLKHDLKPMAGKDWKQYRPTNAEVKPAAKGAIMNAFPHYKLEGKKGDKAVRSYGKLRDKIERAQQRKPS